MSKQGERYPSISAGAGIRRIDNLTSPYRDKPTQTGLTSDLSLTWLLLDFGGRDAAIEEKRQALAVADLMHTATIQDQVFKVLQAYFQYAGQTALAQALNTSLAEASANLDAARERHSKGLATIADVLQAKTVLSQARLDLDEVQGQVDTLKGTLTTAMGIPAATPFDIGELPMHPPLDRASDAVEETLRLAEANRPELAAEKKKVKIAQAFQSSMQGLGLLLVLAVLVIYMVLGVLYESFIHPVTILSALPFAGFGALVTLMLFKVDLSLYAFVGIIMLIGLVKKNGIMMVDFAIESQRKQNLDAETAIFEACVVRFRPIMMTSMAALMGTLPIALGLGAGAESRQPLGLAVIGGLLFSQFLTLFITPVIYLYMERFQQFLKKHPG